MKIPKQSYTEEFKREAVKLVDGGQRPAEVARQPGGVSAQAGLPVIHERAAGIDIGSRFHVVAIAPALADEPVQTFQEKRPLVDLPFSGRARLLAPMHAASF